MTKLKVGSIKIIVNGCYINNGRPYFQRAVPGTNTTLVDNIITTATTAYAWLKEHNMLFNNKGGYMQWLEGEIAMKMSHGAVPYGITMIDVDDAYAVNQKHSVKVVAPMNQYREQMLEPYKTVLAI
ncbi:hypothetical protein N9F12_01575 [Burkholderiaceae bacterium]|nr:hypothetical protein [Burkholderiaceae bacterium]